MKTLFLIVCASLMGLGTFATLAHAQLLDQTFTSNTRPKPNQEVSQDIRNVEALKQLKVREGTVIVYAKGLCCPSCSIGVRKKVSVLGFVDTDKPNRGVEIDAKNQLVLISVKSGSNIDMKSLSEAVDDAGYPPVHLYSIKDGKLVTQSFAVK